MNNPEVKKWLAFYTMPRSEKKAAENLLKKGFEIFCPTQTVLKQWSDRKKKVQEPLFTSYIFARLDESERQQVLLEPRIVSNVYWLGRPAVIQQCEIDQIRDFLREYSSADSKSIQVNYGDNAAITAGPFKGETGTIKEKRGKKVVLQIESLGLELQAVVSVGRLELIPE